MNEAARHHKNLALQILDSGSLLLFQLQLRQQTEKLFLFPRVGKISRKAGRNYWPHAVDGSQFLFARRQQLFHLFVKLAADKLCAGKADVGNSQTVDHSGKGGLSCPSDTCA